MKRLILFIIICIPLIACGQTGKLPYKTVQQTYRGDTLKIIIGNDTLEFSTNLNYFDFNKPLRVNGQIVGQVATIGDTIIFSNGGMIWSPNGNDIYFKPALSETSIVIHRNTDGTISLMLDELWFVTDKDTTDGYEGKMIYKASDGHFYGFGNGKWQQFDGGDGSYLPFIDSISGGIVHTRTVTLPVNFLAGEATFDLLPAPGIGRTIVPVKIVVDFTGTKYTSGSSVYIETQNSADSWTEYATLQGVFTSDPGIYTNNYTSSAGKLTIVSDFSPGENKPYRVRNTGAFEGGTGSGKVTMYYVVLGEEEEEFAGLPNTITIKPTLYRTVLTTDTLGVILVAAENDPLIGKNLVSISAGYIKGYGSATATVTARRKRGGIWVDMTSSGATFAGENRTDDETEATINHSNDDVAANDEIVILINLGAGTAPKGSQGTVIFQ